MKSPLPLAEYYHRANNRPAGPLPKYPCVRDIPLERINEKMLHYLWAEQSFATAIGQNAFRTADGCKVTVNFPGFWNSEEGPDFKQALICVDDKPVSGDIEIHLYSADWYRHKHHRDKQYNKVILHIAGWSDDGKRYVETADGKKIPQLILTSFLEKEFEEIDRFLEAAEYNERNARFGGIGRCSQFCLNPASLKQVQQFLEMAGEARLRYKTELFRQKRQTMKHLSRNDSYNELMYRGIMEALGYQHNYSRFRELAEALPLGTLNKISLSKKPMAFLSLFLHQANLIPSTGKYDKATQEYLAELSRLYQESSAVTGPLNIKVAEWKFKGTRPANYPHRRLAGMSYFLGNCLQEGIFRKVLSCYSGKIINPALQFSLYFKPDKNDEYWLRRFAFGGRESSRPLALIGKGTVQTIEANIVIPLLLFYAEESGDTRLSSLLIQRFKQYPRLPENHITNFMYYRLFADKKKLISDSIKTAFHQQALIQVFRDFCAKGFEGCASCGLLKWVGHQGPVSTIPL